MRVGKPYVNRGGGVAIDFSGLSKNQVKFLEMRQTTNTDKEAYEALGQARSTLARWKQNKLFRQAYDSILSPPEEVLDIVVTGKEVVESVDAELRSSAYKLPTLIHRLFQIAQGHVPAESLRAIKQLIDIYGIGPDMLSEKTRSYVQQQIQKWTGKSNGNLTD